MTFEEAIEIYAAIQKDHVQYVNLNDASTAEHYGRPRIRVDGWFTAEQLEALAIVARDGK